MEQQPTVRRTDARMDVVLTYDVSGIPDLPKRSRPSIDDRSFRPNQVKVTVSSAGEVVLSVSGPIVYSKRLGPDVGVRRFRVGQEELPEELEWVNVRALRDVESQVWATDEQ